MFDVAANVNIVSLLWILKGNKNWNPPNIFQTSPSFIAMFMLFNTLIIFNTLGSMGTEIVFVYWDHFNQQSPNWTKPEKTMWPASELSKAPKRKMASRENKWTGQIRVLDLYELFPYLLTGSSRSKDAFTYFHKWPYSLFWFLGLSWKDPIL